MGESILKAVLVAISSTREAEETKEHLDELAFLAETAGIKTEARFVQNLPHPDSRTFLGKGKLEAEYDESLVIKKYLEVLNELKQAS